MGYQALLFCPDDKTARTVTQVLSELEFTVEASIEPFAAVKKLMGQHFEAIVVDCDNEQNATLLFKSARHSTSNQTSLAVAVVEGQAGVAKAFRMGANLVLTKPINMEQAKGTLRVARGLLRKSDPAKPGSPTATGSFLVPLAPTVPSTPAPATSSNPRPAAARGLPPKPAATAKPPQLSPVAPGNTATFKPPQTPAAKPAAPSAWPAAPATPPTLYSAAVATPVAPKMASPTPAAELKPPVSSMPGASGAASAPAPAREAQVQNIDEKPPAAADLFEKPVQPAGSEPAAYVGSAPSFSFGGAMKERQPGGAGNKVLIGVAAALLIAAGGTFGWSHFKGTNSSTEPVDSSAVLSSPASPQPASAQAAAATTAATTTARAAPPEITGRGSATASGSPNEGSPANAPSSRPSAAFPTSAEARSAPTRSAVREKPSEAKTSEALVVKGGTVPIAHPAPATSPDAPAPSLIAMGAPAASSLPNLGTGNAGVKPMLQTLSVSQGVSQGLLYKKVAPSYPQNALRMHVEGTVELLATISGDGNITHIKLVSGNPQLAEAASNAVKQWKYKPYLLNGEPVEIQTQVTVNFKLPH